MAILTDKDAAPEVTLSDLIHIVDVSDTAANPLGTSKKASIQQVRDLIAGSVDTFLELTDTPANYTGHTLKGVRVNAGETGLEFYTIAGGGDMLGANNLSDVANAATAFINIKQAASTTVTGVGEIATQTEVNTGTDSTRWLTPSTLANSTLASNVSTNNAKVTNATHTGDVTGSTSLAINKTAITGRTTVTAASGDFILVTDATDSDNLKKVNALDFLSGGGDGNGIYDGDGTLTADTTITTAGFDIITSGTGNLGLGVTPSTNKLRVNGQSRFDGRVGIGITSDATRVLRVEGNSHFNGRAQFGHQGAWHTANNLAVTIYNGASDSYPFLTCEINAGVRFEIGAKGNTGIGRAGSTNKKLWVENSDTIEGIRLDHSKEAIGGSDSIAQIISHTGAGVISALDQIGLQIDATGHADSEKNVALEVLNGLVILNLPTSAPTRTGVLWSNAGAVEVS